MAGANGSDRAGTSLTFSFSPNAIIGDHRSSCTFLVPCSQNSDVVVGQTFSRTTVVLVASCLWSLGSPGWKEKENNSSCVRARQNEGRRAIQGHGVRCAYNGAFLLLLASPVRAVQRLGSGGWRPAGSEPVGGARKACSTEAEKTARLLPTEKEKSHGGAGDRKNLSKCRRPSQHSTAQQW